MSAGIADHRVTKGSPPCNSNTKTSALTRMMTAVTTERCRGRRDASPSGIMVPMLSSTLAGAGGERHRCVSSRHRRRGTYTYQETLQLTLATDLLGDILERYSDAVNPGARCRAARLCLEGSKSRNRLSGTPA